MTHTLPIQQLGRYEILEKIGEGGFGIVYRGRDPMLERSVAIKVLRADLASAPDFVERFRREARLAASLRHPNIVTVIEVGEQDGRYYLVMDDLPGGSLSGLLAEGRPLPLVRAVELLRPLAEALDYAHSRGMIHRDVKPSNIMFAEDGRPVLTDFGLVKSTVEAGSTTTGTVLGTAEYMAPEQIQGKEVGPATDLYALGVVAFHMLTGQVPFKGTTPFEIQSGHVNQPPPDPQRLNPALPQTIAGILQRALAKEPSQRFSSGGEMAKALEQTVARITQEQASALLKEGQRSMEDLKFEEAIAKLEKLQALQPDAKGKELLKECRRRQTIYKEAQELLAQQKQISTRLSQLSSSEKWIQPEVQSPAAIPNPEPGLQELPYIFQQNLFEMIAIAGLTILAINFRLYSGDYLAFVFYIGLVGVLVSSIGLPLLFADLTLPSIGIGLSAIISLGSIAFDGLQVPERRFISVSLLALAAFYRLWRLRKAREAAAK